MTLPRCWAAVVLVGALVLAACSSSGASPSAAVSTSGAPSESPSGSTASTGSTPVDLPAPDGVTSSYVVNADGPGEEATGRAEAAVTAAGGVVVQSWPQIGVVVAQAETATFREDLRADSDVSSVGTTRSVPVVPTGEAGTAGAAGSAGSGTVGVRSGVLAPDPLEGDQWDLRAIRADQAHAVTEGDPSVVVGILDSGIDPDHPDLVANLDVEDSASCVDGGRLDTSATGWAPTAFDHGTHVAGTVAAARNGVGIVGVAPGVRVASVKVVDDDGLIYPEYAVCGFMWAGLREMTVTNNSYFVDPFQFYCDDQPDQAAAAEAVHRAVAWATEQGVVHVAAAGNASYDLADKTTDDTSPNDGTPVDRVVDDGCRELPAELPGVVAVSATVRTADGSARLAPYSNRGLGVIDVGAPGTDIVSTIVEGDGWAASSGTSAASPHVAGVLALMASVHPERSPEQLVDALFAGADPEPCRPSARGAACIGPPGATSYLGAGLVDALAAVS